MRGVISRRPSAAIIIAALAIAVVASGTATAAVRGHAGNKLIKKHSLSGNRLKDNSISGKQIQESTLGTVNNTKTVNGSSLIHFVRFVDTNTATTSDSIQISGLNLDLDCDSQGRPRVWATTKYVALLRGTVTYAGEKADTIGVDNLASGGKTQFFDPTYYRGGFTAHWVTPSGGYVDVEAVVGDAPSVGGYNGCVLEGTAVFGND